MEYSVYYVWIYDQAEPASVQISLSAASHEQCTCTP